MALTIDTFEDLVYIVETHPEWRRRIKRALFDIDIEASTRELEKAVAEMVAVHARVWPAIERLLAEQSKQSADIAVLKTDVAETKQRVTWVERDVATLKGKSYEHDYRLKANAIFGRFIRRGKDRTEDMADLMHEAVTTGQISEKELTEVLAADLLWGGKTRQDRKEIVVVLEASWRAEISDVERAQKRAILPCGALACMRLRSWPATNGTSRPSLWRILWPLSLPPMEQSMAIPGTRQRRWRCEQRTRLGGQVDTSAPATYNGRWTV